MRSVESVFRILNFDLFWVVILPHDWAVTGSHSSVSFTKVDSQYSAVRCVARVSGYCVLGMFKVVEVTLGCSVGKVY